MDIDKADTSQVSEDKMSNCCCTTVSLSCRCIKRQHCRADVTDPLGNRGAVPVPLGSHDKCTEVWSEGLCPRGQREEIE